MCSASAVLDSLEGKVPTERPSPEAAGAALDRIARAQTIKCSPLGDRSAPSGEMISRCPSRYLPELEVLQPGALVALGERARDAIEGPLQVRWTEQPAHFKRGRGLLDHRVSRPLEK